MTVSDTSYRGMAERRSAVSCQAALGAEMLRPMSPPAPRALVGRTRERDALNDLWAAARGGRPGVCVVVGPAGFGKTSLVETWAAGLDPDSTQVVWGRCWEGGGAPPYWPWVQLLRACRPEAEAPDADDRLAAWLAPRAAPGEGAEERFAKHEALASLFEDWSRERALVLALDDLHAADLASLEALWFLGRGGVGGRWLVVATSRPLASEARRTAADRLRYEIERASHRVILGPLSRDEVGAFLEDRGLHLDAAAVDRVHAVTEGHPLFLEEILRLGRGRLAAGDRDELISGAVFGAVGEVIRRRLDDVPAATRDALGWAAMFGRDFQLVEVAETSGLPASDLEAACRVARTLEIVEPGPAGTERFTHGLLREALYQELDPIERAARHRAIAQSFEDRATGGWAEVAHHALGSVSSSLRSWVIEAVERAAEEACRALAFDDALALWERAAALARTVSTDPELQFEVRLQLGRHRLRAGRFDDGKSACKEAADLARRLDDPDRFARAALACGETLRLFYVDPALVDLLREAEDRLARAESPRAALVAARLASALQPADDPGIPVEKARRAIEIARRFDDEGLELEVIFASVGALMDVVPPDERIALNIRAAVLAERRGDQPKLLRSWARLIIDRLEMGALDEADVTIERYAALADRFPQPVYRWRTALFRSMRAILDGAFSEAEGHLAAARTLAEATRDPDAQLPLRAQRIALARARGDPAALRAAEVDSRDLFSRVTGGEPWHALLRVALLVQLGDLEAARAGLESARLDHAMLRHDGAALAWMAEACLAVGSEAMMARTYDDLVGSGRTLVSWGLSLMVMEGPMASHAGRLADRLGRPDEAARHFEEALNLTRDRMGPDRVRTLSAYAEALDRRGETVRARKLRAEAERFAKRLGLFEAATEPRAAEVSPATRPAPAAPVERTEPLSLTRQGSVWTLRRDGREARVPHSRGLEMLARLVSTPGVPVHVLELAGSTGTDADWGSSGTVFDAEAKRAYQRRYRELAESIEDHEQAGQPALAEAARAEREALERELLRGLDRKGRPRAVGSAAERARVNVQRRLRHALDKIETADEALGRRLRREVETGTFCVYEPLEV